MHSEQINGFPRRLELEGSPNVRDLGGYPTRSGGRTRWKRILRAGRLSSLTPGDQAMLADYDLRVICDFRHTQETTRDPSRIDALKRTTIHNLAIVPGSHTSDISAFRMENYTAADMAEFMVQINREFALQQTQAYRRMFELLLDTEDGGFLFHCSAGKDRTGFAAAMILAALGVSRATIMEDYLLSAKYYPSAGELEYLASKYSDRGTTEVDHSVFHALMDTREQYLSAAFDAIDERYESLETYLEQALGVCSRKRAQLIERYVE